MIQLKIQVSNPLTHLLEVELIFDTKGKSELDLYQALWRPGRYERADFIENISNFSIVGIGNKAINWQRTQSNHWKITDINDDKITVRYQYYANKMDAGNCVVNEGQIYINFLCCTLFLDDHQNEPIAVDIDIPSDYKIACALTSTENTNFIADSYHQLADSPLLASEQLTLLTYDVSGCTFQLWFMGDHPLDDTQIISDFKKFTEKQSKSMGGFPCKRYLFIIQSLDYKHYHGVEHQDSTVLVLGPNKKKDALEYYDKLIGVASHELFHAWNVTRIRPFEMAPYNYKQEVSFETGFVAEGFTTYFGDLFLTTSGIFSIKGYFSELDKLCNRHFQNFGRFRSSLSTSSKSLWIDGYKNPLPSNKVSIYVKGALASLILDLNIRKETHHAMTLLDVIKVLNEKHTFTQGGYTNEDVLKVIEEVGGQKILSLAKTLIQKKDPIDEYLATALGFVGCELSSTPSEIQFTSKSGAKLQDKIIVDIAPGSPAQNILSIGDQILEMNGKFFDPTSFIEAEMDLVINRNSKKIKITIVPNQNSYLNTYSVRILAEATNDQIRNRNMWLEFE